MRYPCFRLAILVVAVTAVFQPIGYANPVGGTVAAGTANIVATSANRLDINQTSAKAIINWNSFNVGSGETTSFNQPNRNAVTLNRIGDANPSLIMGQVRANGTVMLINPNGMMIGTNSNVNVGNLVLSTANVTDANFMDAKYAFSQAGKPDAQIHVNGRVTTDGGYTAIVAPKVNVGTTGNIQAKAGKVALGGGDVFTLDLVGDHLVNFALPAGVVRSGEKGNNASVNQAGAIYADAGTVELTAKSANSLLDSVVNMSGVVQAHSLAADNGRILIKGDNVSIPGQLNVLGEYVPGPQGPGGPGGVAHDGGKITVDAAKNLTFTGSARADANSLEAKGGSIYMAGRNLKLGGSARTSVNNPGITLASAGTTTFYAKGTFNINAAEAATIADSLVDGGTTNVLADKNIVVNSAIDGPMSYVPGKLVLGDGNGGGDLHVNLHRAITLMEGAIQTGYNTYVPRQTLDGEAGRVTVHENASLQNGVDVAHAGANINVYHGYYGDVTIDTPDLNLKGPNAGIPWYFFRRPEASIGSLRILENADNTSIDGFVIFNRTFEDIQIDANNVQIKNSIVLNGPSISGTTR